MLKGRDIACILTLEDVNELDYDYGRLKQMIMSIFRENHITFNKEQLQLYKNFDIDINYLVNNSIKE